MAPSATNTDNNLFTNALTSTLASTLTNTLTNTLVVSNLDNDAFLEENLAEIRRYLEQHGDLRTLIPISSLGRVLAVFHETEDAMNAKRYCNRTPFLGRQIRVFDGPYTPDYEQPEETRHLTVPEHDKNWLLSPPGSPPLGWAPALETGPNTKTLSDDLALALANVSADRFVVDDDELHTFSLNGELPVIQVPTLAVVSVETDDDYKEDDDAQAQSSKDASLPKILIQDWDDSAVLQPTARRCEPLQTRASLFPSLMHRPPTPLSSRSIIHTPRPPIY